MYIIWQYGCYLGQRPKSFSVSTGPERNTFTRFTRFSGFRFNIGRVSTGFLLAIFNPFSANVPLL